MNKKTTVVLVHGALTDASVWNGVATRLHEAGYNTAAPAMPLRGLQSDARYLAEFLKTIEGPKVLAGHSYGGSVISHPLIPHKDVAALVFVAAFAPDTGESTGELNERFPGSKLGDATIDIREYPGGSDLYLRKECFVDVYAADLPAALASVMASAQRPLEVTALSETFDGLPSWRFVQSWSVITTHDNSLPAETQKFMAQRAGSKILEVDASHAVPVSQCDIVADVIEQAIRGAA